MQTLVVDLRSTIKPSEKKLPGCFNYLCDLFYSLQVQLKKGETDLDFKNYGLEIKVKFHDKDKLQALSSSIQSGGEKSVTTALYMMALQDMTQVHKRDITERSSGSLLLNSGFKLFVQFFQFFKREKASARASSDRFFLVCL